MERSGGAGRAGGAGEAGESVISRQLSGVARAMRAIAIAAVVTCGIGVDLHAQLRARVHASGFASPIAFAQDPADRAVQFVVQQGGRIRVIRAGTVLPADFIDLSAAIVSGGEQGLLGLAFPPEAAASGRFFVNFTNRSGDTVVARLRRSADAMVADPASRFDLRWGGASGPAFIAQPFANHNGGHLAFGPDGYLYVGLGDGGSGNDPGSSRPESGRAPREDAAHRRQRRRCPSIRLPGPARQPVRPQRTSGNAAGDLELRAEEPVALYVRRSGARGQRRTPDRRCRTGPVRGDRLRAGQPRRTELRMAESRRRPRQRHLAPAGISPARRSDPRVPTAASDNR